MKYRDVAEFTPRLAVDAYRSGWHFFLWPQLLTLVFAVAGDNPLIVFCGMLAGLHEFKHAAARALDCECPKKSGVVFRIVSVLRYVLLNTAYAAIVVILLIALDGDRMDDMSESKMALNILVVLSTVYFCVAWFRWPGFGKSFLSSWSSDYWDFMERRLSIVGQLTRPYELAKLPDCSLKMKWLGAVSQMFCFLSIFAATLQLTISTSLVPLVSISAVAALLVMPIASLLLVGNGEILAKRWAALHPDITYRNPTEESEEITREKWDFVNTTQAAVRAEQAWSSPVKDDLSNIEHPNASHLLQAVTNNRFDLVVQLHSKGAGLGATTPGGRTLLMLCASQESGYEAKAGTLKIAEYLLQSGADPKLVHPEIGYTALHFAANTGNLDIVKLLLKKGVSLDARTARDETAIQLACASGHLNVVRWLMANQPALSLSNEERILDCLERAYTHRHFSVFEAILGRDEVKDCLRDNSVAASTVIQLCLTPIYMRMLRKVVDILEADLLAVLSEGRWETNPAADSLQPWSEFTRAPDEVLCAIHSSQHGVRQLQPWIYWSIHGQHVAALASADLEEIDIVAVPNGWHPNSRIEIGTITVSGVKELLRQNEKHRFHLPTALRHELKSLGYK